MNELKCRICKCTPTNACPGGCEWWEQDPQLVQKGAPICTVCAAMREAMSVYVGTCRHGSMGTLRRRVLSLLEEVAR